MSFKKVCFLVLAGICVTSVGARAWLGDSSGAPSDGVATLLEGKPGDKVHDGLVPSLPDTTPPESALEPPAQPGAESPVAEAMPYVTEGSFFAMIGFALGYLSKKILKLMLLLVALLFLAVQGLSYAEVVHVDWDRAIDLLNGLVLNLQENQTIGEIVKDRLPTVGGLGVGYALGFRRG